MVNGPHGATENKLPFARTRWAMVGFVAGVFTWSFAAGGHPRRGPNNTAAEETEKTGESADSTSTLSKVYRGIESTTSSVRDRISDVQNSARNMGLRSKVKTRLGQEKSIDDDRIEVDVLDDGTVVLKGQVPDASAKELAVDIARDTQGVVRVEDRLSVPTATRVFADKPDDESSTPHGRRIR